MFRILILLCIFFGNSNNVGRYTIITNLTTCDYYYHSITDYGIYDVKIPSKFELLITMNDDRPMRILLEVRDSCIPDCDPDISDLNNTSDLYRIKGSDGDTYQDLILGNSIKRYFILPPKCYKI